jgi:ATP-dependent Lhr-like helicase
MAAIERVRDEVRPDPRDADELHDWLMTAGFLDASELSGIPDGLIGALGEARRVAAVRPIGRDSRMWVAAERLPELMAIHPDAVMDVRIEAPPSRAGRRWTRDEAIAEVLRSRMTLTGPVTATMLARSLHVAPGDAEGGLLALESQGVVLRGCFTPGMARELEWCDRSLLARVHRYTLNRLRAEIEPVSPADFMRFLFAWQHVAPASRLKGIDGLREAIATLDGFELAAGAWERAVLPGRVADYAPQMLDMLCLAGEVAWGRLSGAPIEPGRVPQLGSATPVALFLREHEAPWRALHPTESSSAQPTLPDAARGLLDLLRRRGASFLTDLTSDAGLDRYALNHALGTLVACGLAGSDGFSGLRQLLSTAHGHVATRDRRGQFAGRWTATRLLSDEGLYRPSVEVLAQTLLRRYGIVFRRVVARESAAVPWRDLVRVFRQQEARGEIRGGRFVSGMSGEQFALPAAVERMREIRRTPPDDRPVAISTADPLNLAGIVTGTERIRAAARNRLVYLNGIPVAVAEGDFVRELIPLDQQAAAGVAHLLGRRRIPSLLAT